MRLFAECASFRPGRDSPRGLGEGWVCDVSFSEFVLLSHDDARAIWTIGKFASTGFTEHSHAIPEGVRNLSTSLLTITP